MTSTLQILINNCFGGFGLSVDATYLYDAITNNETIEEDERTDINLINVVKLLGSKANDKYARIVIYDIAYPSIIPLEIIKKCIDISEYDGSEDVSVDNNKLTFALSKAGVFSTIAELNEFHDKLEINITASKNNTNFELADIKPLIFEKLDDNIFDNIYITGEQDKHRMNELKSNNHYAKEIALLGGFATQNPL